jgi:hypothetical protein
MSETTTQTSDPAATTTAAKVEPAAPAAPPAPKTEDPGPWTREIAGIMAPLVAKAVEDALAKMPKPEPAKSGDADRIARLEQQLAQRAADEQRIRFEGAALAGVPPTNLELARTLLAGVVGSGPLDPANVATVRANLERIMPTLYREPGSSFSALPVRAGDGSIDWASVTDINQLPEGSMHLIPPEHWERLTRGGGSSSSTLPKTNTTLRVAK